MSDLLYYEYISRLIKFLMNLKRWLLELDLNAQHSVIFFFFCKGNLVLTVIVHWYRLSILCVNIWFFFFFSHAMDLCLRTKNFLPFFFWRGVWYGANKGTQNISRYCDMCYFTQNISATSIKKMHATSYSFYCQNVYIKFWNLVYIGFCLIN